MVTTPVLFATFARPEYARETFNAIKKAEPKKLYFYSNKARTEIPGEIDKNNQVRSLIHEVDWDCELKVNFREQYVDIYTSLWGAYDWIFENEEEAIILEEDCVPSLAFFDFCDQLILKYRYDQRIWVISGNNFIEGYNPNNYDYFFNYFNNLYGWASWKDRWKRVNRGPLPVKEIVEYKLFDQIYNVPKASKIALRSTKKMINTKAWDHRFLLSMKCEGALGIIPKINLVKNVGVIGEHNKGFKNFVHDRSLPNFTKYIINHHPPFVVSDYGYSNVYFRKYYFKRKSKFTRLKNKVINFLSRLYFRII